MRALRSSVRLRNPASFAARQAGVRRSELSTGPTQTAIGQRTGGSHSAHPQVFGTRPAFGIVDEHRRQGRLGRAPILRHPADIFVTPKRWRDTALARVAQRASGLHKPGIRLAMVGNEIRPRSAWTRRSGSKRHASVRPLRRSGAQPRLMPNGHRLAPCETGLAKRARSVRLVIVPRKGVLELHPMSTESRPPAAAAVSPSGLGPPAHVPSRRFRSTAAVRETPATLFTASHAASAFTHVFANSQTDPHPPPRPPSSPTMTDIRTRHAPA